MKILILGAGGIGGYFGARLMQSGCDVTFLVREARQALIAEQGLRIETPHGAFTVQPRTVTTSTLSAGYDLVILATKAYDLEEGLAGVEKGTPGAFILPFLNGIDHLDLLDQHFGRARVIGGVAHIAATVAKSGAVQQLSDLHRLTIGARDAAQEGVVQEFIGLCRKSAFDSVLSADIEQVLWDKWVFLATLAGMTTLCRGSVGDIVATPHGESQVRRMYEECQAVAAASGHAVSSEARDRDLALLTAKGSAFTASMLRDLIAGQRTEHEDIIGAMGRRGQAHGLSMDLLLMAYTHLLVETQVR